MGMGMGMGMDSRMGMDMKWGQRVAKRGLGLATSPPASMRVTSKPRVDVVGVEGIERLQHIGQEPNTIWWTPDCARLCMGMFSTGAVIGCMAKWQRLSIAHWQRGGRSSSTR